MLEPEHQGQGNEVPFRMTIRGICSKEKKSLKLLDSNLGKCRLSYEYTGPSACPHDVLPDVEATFESIGNTLYEYRAILMVSSGLLILVFDYQYMSLVFGLLLWHLAYLLITLIWIFIVNKQNMSSDDVSNGRFVAFTLGAMVAYFGSKEFTGVCFGLLFFVIFLAIGFIILKDQIDDDDKVEEFEKTYDQVIG